MSVWKRIVRKALAPPDGEGPTLDEALEAEARSDEALSAIRQQSPEIVEISRRNRTLREHNNFANMITALFGGTR